MQLALDEEQATVLKAVLDDVLDEMTSEIAGTDNFEYRDGLRRRRELVADIRERLQTTSHL